MKTSKRIKLLLLSLLAILIISAASFLKNADDSKPSLGMQIYRLDDGTTIVVNSHNGFEFTIPTGWYSLLLPASPDEIEKFNTISQQNNLPLDKNWALNQTYDKLLLTVVDLDPDDYKSDTTYEFDLYAENVTKVVPSGLLPAFIDLLKLSGRVTNTYVTKYSEQEVGFVEFQSLEDDPSFIGGKLLVFIRNGNLYAILGQTDNEEMILKIKQAINDIGSSLKFYDMK